MMMTMMTSGGVELFERAFAQAGSQAVKLSSLKGSFSWMKVQSTLISWHLNTRSSKSNNNKNRNGNQSSYSACRWKQASTREKKNNVSSM